MSKEQPKILRAAGYCRTSGEGQRDNTSIGTQQHTIKGLVGREGWTFVSCYVDECKTGSKIAGRDSFRQMLADAALGKFDVVLVADIDRLARDGFDILGTTRTLKREFGVDTLDCKGPFDTRDRRRGLINFLQAGIAEDERLRIAERTITGRMRRAAEGLPWTGRAARPVGRDWDAEQQQWYVTDRGKAIAKLVQRYLAGEGTTKLARELGVTPSKLGSWINHGQLCGPYVAHFVCPELEIDQGIEVPGMPEVLPSRLVEKAKARLVFGRTNNRVDVQRYVLGGFLRCGICHRALTGRDSHGRKSYYHIKPGEDCGIHTLRADDLEAAVLDYLYRAFLDKPAFNKAVEAAAPSAKDRKAMDKERAELNKQLAAAGLQIGRLADAVAGGMDLSLLLSKQESLRVERDRLAACLADLEARQSVLPDPELTKRAAMVTRLRLMQLYKGRDWRKLPFDDVRTFLLHLFGETTVANGRGILITRDAKGEVTIAFKGQVDFQALLVNGRPFTKAFLAALDRWNTYADQYSSGVKPDSAYLSAR